MNILLVEDEAIIALDLEMQLEDAGANVLGPYASLSAATTAIKKHSDIDAALLDIMLGREEVYPAADLLQLRNVAIVFHSGHVRSHEIESRFPDAALCRKPSSPTDLINTISQTIAQSANL